MEEGAMLSDAIVKQVLDGFPVIYPTSNLPALGCIPTTEALDRLYELKQRAPEMKVSLAVADLKQAGEIVEISPNVVRLLSDFPPSSLTLVLPAIESMDERVGGNEIAVRVIDTPISQQLLKTVGPLTATSANLSGIKPETDCASAALSLHLDSTAAIASYCSGGPPSTLIRCDDYADLMSGEQLQVLREGIVSKSEVKSWSMKMN
ncbi:MAG: L-threonylcarbamoyladenylate synthase [Candidatus Thalassarchaeaceae archaeon]|nr:L-threonylcarbamoyladenylate synthase [Candidatus Thalassarchaeaceae archaeon]